MDYQDTINRFRAAMCGMRDYHSQLVRIERAMEIPGEIVEGELYDVYPGKELVGNAEEAAGLS